jgi:predicted transcriptional regulator
MPHQYYHPLMTTISLKVPDELVSRMDAIARTKHTSRSALLRDALEEKLQAAASNIPLSLYEQSADLCGMGSSGFGDLASNPGHMAVFGSRMRSSPILVHSWLIWIAGE